MPSTDMPFEFNSAGNGSNTRVEYALRDGATTVKESIVLEGKISVSEIDEIIESLKDGKQFLPRQVGLPDLLAEMPSSWVEEDKDYYHEILRVGYVNAEPDDYVTADQFVTMVINADIPHEWNTEQQAGM